MSTWLTTSQVTVRRSSGALVSLPDLVFSDQRVLIQGENGIGKSTFLNMVAGFLPVFKGDFFLHPGLSQVSFIPQDHALIGHLSVEDNIALGAVFKGPQKIDLDRLNYLIQALDLSTSRFSLVHSLSQGQQQRVAIARALLSPCDLLIADEPTASLDPSICESVVDLIMAFCSQYKTRLLWVSHQDLYRSHVDSFISFSSVSNSKSPSNKEKTHVLDTHSKTLST